jgi:hypothetical protein
MKVNKWVLGLEVSCMKIPSELDGARVILYTINSPHNKYGTVGIINENNEVVDEIPITAKAICQYEGSKEFYLFSCDMEWEVIGDMDYYSIEEAKESARLSNGVKENEWIEGGQF